VSPTLESHVLVEETSEFRRFLANSYFFIVDSAGNQLPYIDEHYEIYSEDNEVTILKMINGEIDYKQQGINLAHFPTLKENEEGHSYRVMLKPAPGEENYITFNITHQDQAKAKIFGDVRFRQAMSLAINRDEINEIVYLGQGRPMQALPANFATTDFVDEAWLKAYTEYDPEQANALLDEMGLTKRDSEGFRLRFDGEPLVVLFYYAPQCGPAELFELVKGYWDKVGVRTELKELTSDVYRERTSSNKHDIATWGNGYSVGSLIAGNPQVFYPPFGNPIDQRTGIAWAEWKRTNGAGGLEPPEDIKRLFDLADRFKKFPLGSQESNRVGAEMVKIHADNLLGIGTVGDTPDPIFVNNRVGNFGDPPAKYYGAYWIYPMRPAQWYIKK
jgi:peptide/nickel transport system substrate-binding protein